MGPLDSIMSSYQVEICWYTFVIELCGLRPYVITIRLNMCLVFPTEWKLIVEWKHWKSWTNFCGRIAYFYWLRCSHLFNIIDDRGGLCIWCCIGLYLFTVMIKQIGSCELCFLEYLDGIANYLYYDVMALPVWIRRVVVSYRYSIVVRMTANWELHYIKT